MNRHDKTARLPEPLQRGENTATILDWLNRESRAFEVLQKGSQGRPLSDRISTMLMVELIRLMEETGTAASTPEERWGLLEKAFAMLNQIRRAETRAGRLTLDRMKLALKALEKGAPLTRREERRAAGEDAQKRMADMIAMVEPRMAARAARMSMAIDEPAKRVLLPPMEGDAIANHQAESS